MRVNFLPDMQLTNNGLPALALEIALVSSGEYLSQHREEVRSHRWRKEQEFLHYKE